uniref:CCHC-type domain-containing protein n=1 Tax=Tanacetum cinerariifolium TaxID=118510 RepID=A0A6L2K4Z4_TANCI|nr:hypothetical protein [Tanacetum cinerariifolium]
MVNVIPPDHVDDVPVVELNKHDDVYVVLKPVLVDEDEDPKKEEFKEEEEPHEEEEEDMEVNIEEDEINQKPKDVTEVENTIEHEDDTIPAIVHEMASLLRRLCGHETAHALVKKKGKAKEKYYGKLILDLGNEVRYSVEQGTAAMEKLVEKLGNAEDKAECMKLKKELEEAMFSNTFLRMQNERVERDLYWTRESVDAAISVERARHANAGNDARGSEPVRGQDVAPAICECTFAGVRRLSLLLQHCKDLLWTEMKQMMTLEFCPIEELQRIEHELWNLKFKEYNIMAYTQRFNELSLMCPRMVEPERVKVDAYNRGLTDNIKGKVTSSKPVNLNKAVCMAHKLMEHKLQARDERILEGKKRKWESFQSGNSSGKRNHKDKSCQTFQNNQKQGNARAMTTALTVGKVSFGSLPLCKRCFTRHVGPCNIKCHKCGKVGHKARYCKEKNVATGANTQPIPTCYDCGGQGHSRNRCLKKVKKEEIREVRGRAYAIKDAEPQGPNVVTGMFLLNNRRASVLFDLGIDRSFMDTRFSSMLNINPVKIGASYEVELADGRIVSTNTILKGCTLNLVNHIFEIDLMPIDLGTSNVIIGMDWLVKHDAVIVYGEKVVRIPYGNKTLIVESDKGVSRLKVISCIKAHKYVKRGCHLFLAHVTEKKSKEKQLEDVP